MAKELPYFKFYPSEYINGDITLEDFYVQGVFANIMAYYWFKCGKLTLSDITKRLKKAKPYALSSLIESGIIKIDEEENVFISFLDEQLEERQSNSKIKSLNGSKGGAPVGNKNAEKDKLETSKKQAKTTNIEKRREEEEKNKKREEALNALPVEVVEVWNEWENYRKEKKQKLTPSTRKKQIEFLTGRAGPEIKSIINQSIQNGWTGLFELKNQQSHVSNKGSTTAASAIIKPKSFGNIREHRTG